MTNAFLEAIWKTHLEGRAWQVKEEFLSLLQFMLDNKVNSVLEIGTHKGGTALGFLAIGCSVLSTDIIKQPEVEELERNHPDKFKFRYRHDWDNNWHDDDNYGAFNMLFIDGDHSYESCLKDALENAPLIVYPGFIVFHDSAKSEHHKEHGCEVWKVIDECVKEWDRQPEDRIDFITDGTWGGITVLKV